MLGRIRVLLVDDEADFLQTLDYWFKTKGYYVKTATDGSVALNIIKADPPDIVFLDIIMPIMDGYQVLKCIRATNKILPVVLMTAYVDIEEAEKKGSAYGISGVFRKGDDMTKTLEFVEKIEQAKRGKI